MIELILLRADGLMFFRLSFHAGLLLICLLSQCSTIRQQDALEKGRTAQFIRIDSLAPPLPLSLSIGDTNRDGLPDLLAGSAIYLNPGGDLMGEWKRINVGIDARSLVLANIDNDGNPDLLALAPPALYWLEALDPEGIKWASTKVANLPFSLSEDVSGLFFDAIHDTWTIAGKDSLFLIQVPADSENQWTTLAQSLEPGFTRQGNGLRLEADLDGNGDLEHARIHAYVIYLLIY